MTVTLDVLRLASQDVILGLPWLQEVNPRIDWKSGKLSFDGCVAAHRPKPTHRQNLVVDEKMINEITSTQTRYKKQRAVDLVAKMKRAMQVPKEEDVLLQIPKVYHRWRHIFEKPADSATLPEHQPWDHEIILEEGKTPPFLPIYGLSEPQLKAVREYINENLAKGYIQESDSPAGFPILFVPKKDGSLRLCVDYRKLNAITRKNRYPLPNISELRDRLSGAKVFTSLDLRDGYYQIRMKKGEEWKTAFRTRYGHYEYRVMPFGLTNAPATFQALINNVLRKHLDMFVIAYLDDILIYSENEADHVKHVQMVLDCLDKYHLRLKPSKCKFHQTELEFLGHTVGINGVKISEEKIRTIKDWAVPRNVKDVQSFLGFTNFNRTFIKNYSQITLPLTRLTRKEVTWKWDEEQQKAFERLKQLCIEEPVLKMFTPGNPSRLETDASDLAMGATWLQEHNGKWHPVAYYSRKFSGAEERYDVHDKELLAIVRALEHWKIYSHSSPPFEVFTDHKNLTYFTTTKKLTPRQVRWSQELGEHKFRIVYTPGKDNGRADALSRRYDIAGTKHKDEGTLFKQNQDGSLELAIEINNVLTITNKVPEELQEAIIREHHDDPVHGHPGVTRTMELIQRNYSFQKMKDKVTNYVRKCADCQKNKHGTHAPYGEMQALELPDEPWTDVSMDFITGLPESRDPVTRLKYDSILVVVDRFTKAIEVIPFQRNYTAVQLGHVINDRVIRYHGIPKTIISDRDKLFTSNYWATLMSAIGIKRKLSTAYHPETDGQTERTNRTLKAYLRTYLNLKQDNWVSLLPMAQLAHNNKLSESTGKTPFFANHGRHPHLFERTLPGAKAEAALVTAEELRETHKEMRKRIEQAQRQSISYVNKKRKTAPQLKRGDKVYLLTKNLRTKRPSKGLDHVKVGPFLVKSQQGPVTYTLDLPPDAKIHPRFHVNKLEPADPETPLQRTFRYDTEEENEFEVERILDHRDTEQIKLREYLVRWLGYDNSENTWEPESNLRNCGQRIKEYWKRTRRDPSY
jgi:transposase InsO family protein